MTLAQMPRPLRWLTLTMIIANISSEMYFPLLPLYLIQLGASVREVGLYFTLEVIFGLIFRILGGWLSDSIGRLRSVALGASFGVVAVLFLTFAPTWQMALIAALTGQICVSLIAPSFQAFTAENAPEGSTGKTFGLVNALFLLCMIIGPLFGAFLVRAWGYRLMMVVASAIYVSAWLIRLWLVLTSRYEAPKPLVVRRLTGDLRGAFVMLFSVPLLLTLFIIDGLRDAGFQTAMPFLPKYITEGGLDEATYAALFSFSAVVSALVNLPAGAWSDRYGEKRMIFLGMSIFGLSLIGMVTLPFSLGLLVVMFALSGAGRALMDPAFNALLSKSVPSGSLGIMWGIFLTALGVWAVPMPYIGGLLYSEVSPTATFIVAGVLPLLGALVLLGLRAKAPLTAPPIQSEEGQSEGMA